MKKILILTTELTGYGHKTVSDSIAYNFRKYKDVEVKCVEAFSFAGRIAMTMSQLYSKSVKVNLKLWEMMYNSTSINSYPLGVCVGLKMERKFIKFLKDYQPDFILSVQPIFVKSTAFVLKKNKIKIPFGVLVTDIASISKCWLDKKPDFYFCTTEETKEICLRYGIASEKIHMVRYPIGKQYESRGVIIKKAHKKESPLKVLLLSGGDGILDFQTIAGAILSNFNSEVTVVTGRNKKLKIQLEKTIGEEYKHRIHIKGFVNNLAEMYKVHDIAIIRASPNVMFEAMLCNIPAIIVSYIPGQETANVAFAEKYNIGIECLDEKRLEDTISHLVANDREELTEMRKKQRLYVKSIPYAPLADVIYEQHTYQNNMKTF